MQFCSKCGNQNNSIDKFCKKCGALLVNTPMAQASQPSILPPLPSVEKNAALPIIIKPPVIPQITSTNNNVEYKNDYDSQFPKKKSPLLFILIPIIIIGGLAAWYFGFREKKDEVKMASEKTLTDTIPVASANGQGNTDVGTGTSSLGTDTQLPPTNNENNSNVSEVPTTSGNTNSSDLSDDEIKTLVQNFYEAENNRDFDKIAASYSPNLKKYYDINNPSYEAVKKRYAHSWEVTSNGANSIKDIEVNRLDGKITAVVTVDYSWYGNKTQQSYTKENVKAFIGFNELGKIESIQ